VAVEPFVVGSNLLLLWRDLGAGLGRSLMIFHIFLSFAFFIHGYLEEKKEMKLM